MANDNERKSNDDTASGGTETITLANVMDAIELLLFYHELHEKEDSLRENKTRLTLIGTVGLSVFLVSIGFVIQTVDAPDTKIRIALSLILVTSILMTVAIAFLFRSLRKFEKEADAFLKFFNLRFGKYLKTPREN